VVEVVAATLLPTSWVVLVVAVAVSPLPQRSLHPMVVEEVEVKAVAAIF
jgi:hypothetical protein